MSDIKLIRDLSNGYGAPGYEDNILEIIKEHCHDMHITSDSMMNLYVSKTASDKARPYTIMLDAHMDEVGCMVQSITDKGLIKFITLGGWVAHNIPAHQVVIKNKDGDYVNGVVSSKPPHFMTPEEKAKGITLKELSIDVGASSRDEVLETYKIDIGAPIVPFVKFHYNQNTGIMMGKAFDNRLGCAAVIETLRQLNDVKHMNVIGALAVQEEVGTRGAMVTSNKIKPDLAIVFEGTPADDIYMSSELAQGVLKKGPQIRYRDNSYVANHRFIDFTLKTASKHGIPYQKAVRTSGGTNAGKIHLSNKGVPTLVLGVPSRYIHTHHCFASMEDFNNTVKLAVELIKNLDHIAIDHILRR